MRGTVAAKRLSFEIALLLAAKLAALTLIYVMFFSASTQIHVDAGAVAARLLSGPTKP